MFLNLNKYKQRTKNINTGKSRKEKRGAFMKKILLFLSLLIILPVSFATSYEQTAADISPGVFTEADYYFPSTLYVGTDEDPGLSSSYSNALYIDDANKRFGIYVYSHSGDAGIYSTAADSASGVVGYSESGKGLYGTTDATSTSSAAVYGYADEGAPAIYGYDASGSGIGVKAYSTNYGFYSSGADYGLYIPNANNIGVYVASSDGIGGRFVGDNYGVRGEGDLAGGIFYSDTYGVYTEGDDVGVYGSSETTGVYGVSSSDTAEKCGVKGYSSDSGRSAYLGCSDWAIYTAHNAKVGGALNVGSCSGCDIAEHFIGENLEPGDVVILDPTSPNHVAKTTTPYDKLAAGIVSTNPTITMGLDEGVPVALSGVVPTKVIGKVKIGDLLTTSSTAGYAMACTDYQKCQGAIMGKAMEENDRGKGTITALVMLG